MFCLCSSHQVSFVIIFFPLHLHNWLLLLVLRCQIWIIRCSCPIRVADKGNRSAQHMESTTLSFATVWHEMVVLFKCAIVHKYRTREWKLSVSGTNFMWLIKLLLFNYIFINLYCQRSGKIKSQQMVTLSQTEACYKTRATDCEHQPTLAFLRSLLI